MKVEFKESNFEGLDIKKSTQYLSSEDADLVTYTIENLPAMVKEYNSPGPTYLYPHLLVMCKSAKTAGQDFTYFNTLNDQYAWYHGLTKKTVNDQESINAKAKELTAGLTTDMAKIKAIFYYVQTISVTLLLKTGWPALNPNLPMKCYVKNMVIVRGWPI
jgi:hypothetical protein